MDQWQDDGLAGPFELADKSRLDAARDEVFRLKAIRRAQLAAQRADAAQAAGQATAVNPLIDRHMDIDVIRDIFFDANLQAVVADLAGEDLFVWRTNFFVKSDGTGQNKWHHDRHFEDGDRPINLFDTTNHFTLTVALTDIGMTEGRIEYVRGSHLPIDGWDRDIPRHIEEVPPVVQDRVTPLPLRRGQFVLLHSSLLHRSLAFGAGERRVSMAARLARTGTAIPPYGAANPAGGAQARAEPAVYYRETGILPFN